MFTESLTIRILADSGPLRSELDDVTRRLDELQGRFDRLSGAEASFGRIATALSAAVGPARALASTLETVLARIGAIARTPVVVDVSPAVASLTRLLGLIELVGARLRALSGVGPGVVGGTGLPGAPGGGGAGGGFRRFASGGLVTGPRGVDRVPALLTAGEFVLRRPATERLGLDFLTALNGAGTPGPGVSPAAAPPVSSSTVTNIGDVNVVVRQAADAAALLREIRIDGARLRARIG